MEVLGIRGAHRLPLALSPNQFPDLADGAVPLLALPPQGTSYLLYTASIGPTANAPVAISSRVRPSWRHSRA